ncbi:hypothetical protein PSEUBRA_002354 [Kalmanozyma brasiliensis GHG001]|uniref:Uncharacterized protein n=1 Tax=Kalmanozyma brasiliensis (strain GHG001) TaxID=1365824 RepID=V5ES33_KALBG|nr:uncharacterized protein PSEUBRA_002354 [Kalmanozyma brasiliensis GHG001]EST07970.1 hypothetical protein PSEUBRA_002354 [Kalmanozyma brasiliensis GHG001]
MTLFAQTNPSWLDSGPLLTLRNLLESVFFRSPEPQPVSTWRLILDPPMPYWVTAFSQTCRLISLLILLPVLIIGMLDFAGYAVFRTLGLHRRRVRIQRQTAAGAVVPLGRTGSRRKPRVYQNDKHRPTDRSNIPSIVQAPLLSPGTYDAETLLRQRARSLSIASAEEHAAWVASGGQQARLSAIAKEGGDATNADSDAEGQDGDYFGRAPRVGVDGPLGLADTDVDSGTESGRDSPVVRRRRGLSGGLNFTPVSPNPEKPVPLETATTDPTHTATAADTDPDAPLPHQAESEHASVRSLSSDSPSSSNGERAHQREGKRSEDGSGSNMSSSWIGVEPDSVEGSIAPPVTVDPVQAAAAAGLEPTQQD